MENCQILFHRCTDLRSLEIRGGGTSKIEALVDYAINNCKALNELRLDPEVWYTGGFTLEMFKVLEDHGGNIRRLEFDQSFIKSCHLLVMPSVLGRLTSLKVKQTYMANMETTFEDLDMDMHIVMQTLGNQCTNLNYLSLNFSYHDGREGFYKDDMEILLSGLKTSLVRLNLGLFRDKRHDGLQVEASPFIHCTGLKQLSIYSGINALDFRAIGQLSSLTDLKIERYETEITDSNYAEAFEQHKLINLQHFQLENEAEFGKNATIAFFKHCPNLNSWTCSSSEIKGLCEAVAECGPQSINLQKLELLHCILNRIDFMAVASLCNLRELSLDDISTAVQSVDYKDAFQQGNLINLEMIKVTNCPAFDTAGFKALIKGSPNLRHITLGNVPELAGFAEAFEECDLKHLETFCASRCSSFRGREMAVLNQSCPKLRMIDVSIEVYDVRDLLSGQNSAVSSDLENWTHGELLTLLIATKEQPDLMSKLNSRCFQQASIL
jgi:hypothetical protein